MGVLRAPGSSGRPDGGWVGSERGRAGRCRLPRAAQGARERCWRRQPWQRQQRRRPCRREGTCCLVGTQPPPTRRELPGGWELRAGWRGHPGGLSGGGGIATHVFCVQEPSRQQAVLGTAFLTLAVFVALYVLVYLECLGRRGLWASALLAWACLLALGYVLVFDSCRKAACAWEQVTGGAGGPHADERKLVPRRAGCRAGGVAAASAESGRALPSLLAIPSRAEGGQQTGAASRSPLVTAEGLGTGPDPKSARRK